MSDHERIQRLESIVRALDQRVAALEAQLAALHGAPPPPIDSAPRTTADAPSPAPPTAVAARAAVLPAEPHTPRPAVVTGAPLDVEALVGRYGTIAIATLAILTGAGVFLTWAVAHGLLGPAARVTLGALGAAAIALTGARLRVRGTVRFGNALLAIALAVVHLDAWAAGPELHVISTDAALAVAAAASMLLATLALRASEEMLFALGLGGAIIAPFVTSPGGGSAFMLTAYGWVIIAGGLTALRSARWRAAVLVIGVGCALYAFASYALVLTSTWWVERHIPTMFALICSLTASLVAIGWGARDVRTRLALAFAAIAVVVQVPTDVVSGHLTVALALAAAGTLASYLALRVDDTPSAWRLAGAVLLPLACLATAVSALTTPDTATGALIAASWAALALLAAWRMRADRHLHSAAAHVASAAALILALDATPERCIATLAVHSVAGSWLLRRSEGRALAPSIALELLLASLWTYVLLAARPAHGTTPFLHASSAAALAVVLAWIAFARALRTTPRDDVAARRGAATAAVVASLAAFIWIRTELLHAFAADTANFLLIVYYALAGVLAIHVGRRRARPPARAVGLALACYAGIKTLAHARDISAIGLRVGSCLLVGLFIALVAYWYRAPDDARSPGPQSVAD